MGTYAPPATLPARWHVRCNAWDMDLSNGTGVLTCIVEMRFPADDVERAVQLLLSTVGRTEAKAGCTSCCIGVDAAEPTRVRYNEIWTRESAFRRHVSSEEFHRVLVAMDMSSEKPEVTVGTLAGHQGLAFLRDLHGGAGATTVRKIQGDETEVG